MNTYITNLNALGGTPQAAQNMVTDIACDKLGFRQMGIYHYNWPDEPLDILHARLDGIMAPVHAGDVVVYQFPTWGSPQLDNLLLQNIKLFNAHLVIFIHDIRALMTKQDFKLLSQEIGFFNQAEVIIAHSTQMIDFLKEHGLKLKVKKTITLEFMDHPVSGTLGQVPEYKPIITYAGNPNDSPKSDFLKGWNNSNVKLRLYGNPNWSITDNYEIGGWQDIDQKLLFDLRENGGFGLLWSSDPVWQRYMTMNAPFKLSTYLAAGIPIIAQSSIAQHDIIKQHHLGILVDSLEEAAERVAQITPEEYNQMVSSIDHFSTLIRQGYFTKKALLDAVFTIYHD